MFSVSRHPLPDDALLARYVEPQNYTDCYTTVVSGAISHSEFVTAFYTTPLFRLERFILKLLVSRPSTDKEAKQLADGGADRFAAWNVEDRSENQLLLCDFRGRTRSWLMIQPICNDNETSTRLYFGSAVTPKENSEGDKPAIGAGFSVLLGFHKLYSRALLSSARLRIKRQGL